MRRRKFFKTGCTCGMLSLISAAQFSAFAGETELPQETDKSVLLDMNRDQVNGLLKFIDSTQSKSVRKSIFNELGSKCYSTRGLDKWIEPYKGNIQAFLDRVNVEKKSTYWESLVFKEDHKVLTLTGKEVKGCACAFADTPEPPKSLCYYCCKNFQQELFGNLLGKKVNVEITESWLLGDKRCSTRIHIV